MNRARFLFYLIIVSLICGEIILFSTLAYDLEMIWSSLFALYFMLLIAGWISESKKERIDRIKKELSEPYTPKKLLIFLTKLVIFSIFMWYIPFPDYV